MTKYTVVILYTSTSMNLSILGIPEYDTMLLSIRLVECIHHCVREISPLKTKNKLHRVRLSLIKEFNHSTETSVQLFNGEDKKGQFFEVSPGTIFQILMCMYESRFIT